MRHMDLDDTMIHYLLIGAGMFIGSMAKTIFEYVSKLLLKLGIKWERKLEEPRDQGCRRPPEGWWCSREPGHDGPCAARPIPPHDWEPDFSEGEPPVENGACGLCGREHR